MFLMKSRWPGASIMVNVYFCVLNFNREMSIVMPRSRSAFNLSRTQAYLKEPFPIFNKIHKRLNKKNTTIFIQSKKPYLGRSLLILLNCSGVNSTTLVDEMTGGRGLATVHMPNYDKIHVNPLSSHIGRRLDTRISYANNDFRLTRHSPCSLNLWWS